VKLAILTHNRTCPQPTLVMESPVSDLTQHTWLCCHCGVAKQSSKTWTGGQFKLLSWQLQGINRLLLQLTWRCAIVM